MELLSEEDRQILNHYNSLLKVQHFEPIKYSDILQGNTDISTNQVKTQSITNEKIQIKNRTPVKKNELSQAIKDLNKASKKCTDNIFKMESLIENSSQKFEKPTKQSNRSKKKLTESPQKQSQIQINEKLVEQIERMFRIKQIDNQFLLVIVKKHLNECPGFAKKLKDDLKLVLQQLRRN